MGSKAVSWHNAPWHASTHDQPLILRLILQQLITIIARKDSKTSRVHAAKPCVSATLLLLCVFLSISPWSQATDNPVANVVANVVGNSAKTTTSHGFSLYGSLKYPVDASHLEYANPQAPKGGSVTLMATGTFDSLNPYILKGLSPWKDSRGLYVYGFGQLHDSLLAGTSSYRQSGDEPQSAYGLIAEKIVYPNDLSWVKFHLRPEARFHDGEPITSADVVFSYTLLKKEGHPNYAIQFREFQRVEAKGPHTVIFHFKQPNQRHLILRAGEMPILPKHYLQNKNFQKTGLTPLLGNGPYRVKKVEPGKTLVLERVTDYWANHLWLNKGQYNFDEVTIDFYRDQGVAFEAFKAKEYDIHVEYVAKNWVNNYDFPGINNGQVMKTEIAHEQPQGSQAFFFNIRNPLFQDRRVRQAISLMFDFQWSNRTLFNKAYRRSNTFFPNSPFAADTLMNPQQRSLLQPFKDILPTEVFTQVFQLPTTDGSGKLRRQRKQALALLDAAGWHIKKNQLISKSTQQAFTFELVNEHSAYLKRILLPFKKNLESIGIDMSVRMVDPTQYKERLDHFDFDMTIFVLPQSLAPGDRPYQYFHSDNANINGNRNISGINNRAVDHLVESLKSVVSFNEVTDIMQALDRVLLWEHYTIPHWHIDYHRIAFWKDFERPASQPKYILGTQTWWRKQETF